MTARPPQPAGPPEGGGEPPLLETRHLEVTYNRLQVAIQGVSLAVPAGSIVALLGTNGAGKTTTLRAIGGFLPADYAAVTDGQVSFAGRIITGSAPDVVAGLGISLVPERDKVFTTLTVEENLRAVARPMGQAARSRLTDWLYGLFPALAERRRQQAGYLSGGERQMLAMAMGLSLQPQLLMIDELSFGLAPVMVDSLMAALQQINRERGTTILLVEQNAAVALEVAGYAYIMETGRMVLAGTPAQLKAHADVQEFYLGLSEAGLRSYAEVKQYRRKRRWWG